jgi:Putative beta-barrel porin-2, OmpL-like. bbp2
MFRRRIINCNFRDVVPVLMLFIIFSTCSAQEENSKYEQSASQSSQQEESSGIASADPSSVWQYGAFLDFGYLWDNNHPANETFRSRGTAYKVDVPIINMAGAYLRKTVSESSRWGTELTVQAGQDTRVFGFSATAPNMPGYRGLRHLGPTNISYLAPVGRGLTIQGGIFSSFIGYDSLYTKDNFSYTRPWGADFTPYFMLGVNASYPLTEKLTGTFFIVNGYWHLANANSVPNWGGQLAYKPKDHWTVKQTVLVGPHQSDTAFGFWRFLSDSTVEWKRDPFTVALEFQGASEKVASPGHPRASWVSSQVPAHWAFNKHWAATVRPEMAWDGDGRWTGFPQTVKAVTSTIEYRVPFHQATAIFRLEHRFDDSRGPGGGFFRGSYIAPGVVGLTPSQHLLVFGAIFTFDGQMRH